MLSKYSIYILDLFLHFQTDSQIQAIVSTYSRLCGSEEQCMAALQALEDEPSCQSSTDPSVIYSGTCTTLHFASIDACPDVGSDSSSHNI